MMGNSRSMTTDELEEALRLTTEERDTLAEFLLRLGPHHTVTFNADGWVMSHPVTCRFLPGGLGTCTMNGEVDRMARRQGWQYQKPGRGTFIIDLDDNGRGEIGQQVPEPTAGDELIEKIKTLLADYTTRNL